jgi:hypothetical protein
MVNGSPRHRLLGWGRRVGSHSVNQDQNTFLVENTLRMQPHVLPGRYSPKAFIALARRNPQNPQGEVRNIY